MRELIIISDQVNPADEKGRTFKEINQEKVHNIPVGTLVEMDDGCRLWVVYHGRDCDRTPLYCLCVDREDTDGPELPKRYPYNWITGYPEESLTPVEKK
jgi:hypothetical protein